MERRTFFAAASVLALPSILRGSPASPKTRLADTAHPGPMFPTQEPELVREMVLVAHSNVTRVKELVGRQPALARAAWDWGFGDWEDALGAASHVGNHDIAEVLLAHGARPSIFSAAMLGQLDVVRGFIAAAPGIQRTKGPHSITLLKHAIAGGAGAKAVVEYLRSVGGADEQPEEPPLTLDQMNALIGTYPYGDGPDESLDVTMANNRISVGRPGRFARGLTHAGSLEFFPVGAESVRIAFAASSSGLSMTVRDPDVVLVAKRR